MADFAPRPVGGPDLDLSRPAGPAIRWLALWKPAAGLLLLLLLSATILLAPIDLESAGAYGYAGLFLITLLTTGSFVLPIPYLAVVFKAGTLLDPLGVALVAGLAAAIGELSGYLLGYLGREAVGEHRWRRRAERWIGRHGFLTTAVLSFVPNPVFDAAGVAAGALRYPVWKFTAACFVGKAAKFLVIAAWGHALF